MPGDAKLYGVRFSPKLFKALQKAAKEDERAMSDIVREAVKQWLARRAKSQGKGG